MSLSFDEVEQLLIQELPELEFSPRDISLLRKYNDSQLREAAHALVRFANWHDDVTVENCHNYFWGTLSHIELQDLPRDRFEQTATEELTS